MKENYNKLKKETNKKENIENLDFKKYNLYQLSNYVDNNKSNITTSKSPKNFGDEENLFK